MLVLLWFSCSSCPKTLERLSQWRKDPGIEIQAVVDADGHIPADAPKNLLLDRNREAMGSLEISGTPSAALLGSGGLLAGGTVVGSAAIRQLVDDVLA